MTVSLSINRIQENMFNVTIFVSYLLIFLSALGLSTSAPTYLKSLDYYLRIYICVFLIWRFNPFKRYFSWLKTPHDEFTSLDRKIAFSAGLFILTTSVINNTVQLI